MKTINQKEFTYCLEQYDQETRVGIFSVRNAFPINSPKKTFRVEVSKYLAGAIRLNKSYGLKRGDKLLGTSFTSTDNDPEYANNPFKLIHFTPDSVSDIPEHFKLELVTEKRALFEDVIHITGERYTKMIKRSIKPKFFKRYIKCINTTMLKDLSEFVTIISPELSK